MNNHLFWLKFGLFSVGLGQSFAFVLVPPLARDLGLSEIQTSTIFAISAVAWAITSASWGRASDNFGRRNIAVIGLIGYSISIIALITPLFLVEQNLLAFVYLFPSLILGRLINGLIGSATRPASFAYLADITPPEKRTVKFARMESSFLVGTVLGPLIGGFLFLFSQSLPFYLFAACALIAAFQLYLKMPNTKIMTDTTNEINTISFRDANVWPFLFFAALISFCQASLLQSIGFYITDIFSDLPDLPLIISICFAILSISTIISQYLFTDLFGLDNSKLLKYGILIVLVSYLFAAYSSSIAIFYFAIILNGIGSGMIRPANASALSLAQSPENQGSAAGYLGSVIPIGHMLTPIVAMPIYQIDPTYLYIFSAILCFIAAIFIIINPTMKSVKLLENE